MSGYLWAKPGAAVDADVQRYLAGDDVILDRHLLPYDIRASAAHVRGLRLIGALSAEEAGAIESALLDLEKRWRRGEFVLDERFEDGHSAIEHFLIERLGPVGAKVHFGRSRNDQVLAAQRLFVRDRLNAIREAVVRAGLKCLDLAEADRDTVMPGYTHLQRAVPSTVGLWMAAYGESFADDAELIGFTRRWLNACPLGTAAGYGVNAPLPRDEVAADLGFERLIVNPMHAQNGRGKGEFQALAACWQALQTVRRLAWDLSLLSTSEFGFVRMGDAVSTGSSIMPNKRNPDLAELLRAAAGLVAGAMVELQQVLSLPGGYHRDLQATKGPVIRGLTHTLESVRLVPVLLERVEFDREAMRAAIDAPMFATDRAVELAWAGVPFREAYRMVASELADGVMEDRRPEASTAARTSPGACADLRLSEIRVRLEKAGAGL